MKNLQVKVEIDNFTPLGFVKGIIICAAVTKTVLATWPMLAAWLQSKA